MRSKPLSMIALFALFITMIPLPVTQAAGAQTMPRSAVVAPQLTQTATPAPGQNVIVSLASAVQRPQPMQVLAPLLTQSRKSTVMAQVTYSLLDSTLLVQNQPQNRQQHSTSALATNCTVTKPTDSGSGSLRQCLLNAATGATIDFDPQKFPPTAPVSITLATPLPFITVNGLTIDGSNAGVILDGGPGAIANGLVISHTNNVAIRGLQILHFTVAGIIVAEGANNTIGGDRTLGAAPLGQGNLISGNEFNGNIGVGVVLQGIGATNNHIVGNFIGTDILGKQALGNDSGVIIRLSASGNWIGGETPNVGNLISGNGNSGIVFNGDGTANNYVVGNYIGTDVSGTQALGNAYSGVILSGRASNNRIGGETPGARNLISGNVKAGVAITDTGTTSNTVSGNYIGTKVSGMSALGNGLAGIGILAGASNNIIGGEVAGARNLISGNQGPGIQVEDIGTTHNLIAGNFIGTDVQGTQAITNSIAGIGIFNGASNNLIGGETLGSRNLISGNGSYGVAIKDSATVANRIIGNFIGTAINGTDSLGNGQAGVIISSGASGNIVGGESPSALNLISGNTLFGVTIQGADAVTNSIVGNFIGTDIGGTKRLDNGLAGVFIGFSANSNIIGGEAPGARNLISGNGQLGVAILGSSMTSVTGNYIGTDRYGMQPLGNGLIGVSLQVGASGNVIGGETDSTRNLISGNGGVGVQLESAGTTGNFILGNFIGTNISGTNAISNSLAGVGIASGASNNRVGGETVGARNLISGNGGSGIQFEDSETVSNTVVGNFIGTDITGMRGLGNDNAGISILNGAKNNIIGGETTSARNLISGNRSDGIYLAQLKATSTTGNRISGNLVGTNLLGSGPISNTRDGIHLAISVSQNTIGVSNTIAYNGAAGIAFEDQASQGNQVTRNLIYSNQGPPIVWPDQQPVDSHPAAPILKRYLPADKVLTGQVCKQCTVEFYANTTANPGGSQYLGKVVADTNGDFSFVMTVAPTTCHVSAFATNLQKTASKFSEPFDICAVSVNRQFLPLVAR